MLNALKTIPMHWHARDGHTDVPQAATRSPVAVVNIHTGQRLWALKAEPNNKICVTGADDKKKAKTILVDGKDYVLNEDDGSVPESVLETARRLDLDDIDLALAEIQAAEGVALDKPAATTMVTNARSKAKRHKMNSCHGTPARL